MFLNTLVFLGLTCLIWRLIQIYPHEIWRILGNLAAIICLIVGLATAPIFLKVLILLGVFLTNTDIYRHRNLN